MSPVGTGRLYSFPELIYCVLFLPINLATAVDMCYSTAVSNKKVKNLALRDKLNGAECTGT